MQNQPVSASHSIKLHNFRSLLRFIRMGSGVYMYSDRFPLCPDVIPGTIRVSTAGEGGFFKRTISFKCRICDTPPEKRPEILKNSLWVATYYDEHGRKRVSGSKAYPLTFSYVEEDGVYNCTLTGTSTRSSDLLVIN